MCLIAFAWGASERFPFVIAANRDEFLARPTAALSLWQSPGGASVLAGRDLRDGGTWMGFSPNGRFAMLTNVRDPQAAAPAQPISRGGLALAWLENDLPAQLWANDIKPQHYQGFNLIVGDWQTKQCHYLSNRSQALDHTANFKPFRPIAGIESAQSAIDLVVFEMPWGAVYGLSNATLGTPWPKTQRLKTALQSSLSSADADQLIAINLQALADRQRSADQQLPQTGVSLELERALSSVFVQHPEAAPQYGTRTSLVAVYEPSKGLQVTELTHAENNSAASPVNAALAWP
ncbi:NRDE family protein [Variovorax sp. PCZ-1]|uniref:NRDE family protein n=1 Tax=Variovorax sp. PCZ-1 TaxID=2835533 RepID=UPI001BCDD6B9|nr:NRDE family protein [Variovorax sp. PCZ-1]MBS7807506.1 NRDE family protein [Variovorax sp. PCZ-1]